MLPTVHVPVMPQEILQHGCMHAGQIWVDGTGGGGGHSRIILERIQPGGRLLILDRDPAACLRLEETFDGLATVRHSSYHNLSQVLSDLAWPTVDGIVLDLGLSSDQLSDRDRGFSFQTEGDLDMRYDTTSGIPAWQWLARVDERTLADTIFQFGEERFSRRIAKRIVETRRNSPIRTAAQLRELIYRSVSGGRPTSCGRRHGRVDPATRTFQALRIEVNQELEILQKALKLLPNCLAPCGRLMVISFHSLEDRLTKVAFREDGRLKVITRKPIQATEEEIASNPRSRSAKLRVAQRV